MSSRSCRRAARGHAVPRFPEVQRDVALWFDEFRAVAGHLRRRGRTGCGPIRGCAGLRQFRLFDLYRPPVRASSKIEEVGANAMLNKEKSLAFRLFFKILNAPWRKCRPKRRWPRL